VGEGDVVYTRLHNPLNRELPPTRGGYTGG